VQDYRQAGNASQIIIVRTETAVRTIFRMWLAAFSKLIVIFANITIMPDETVTFYIPHQPDVRLVRLQ
jgi:hypothetical protein